MPASPPPNPGVRGTFHCTAPRTIKASPERVFRAWTDPERARPWLANGGEIILQPHKGGLFFLDMIYEGFTYPHYGRYLQVEPARLLEFTWMSQGTEGKESIVRVELEPVPEGTRLTLTHTGLPSDKHAREHEGGWLELLRWLEERLD